MFGISFTELLIIGVIALLVLGPERLPRAARFAGLWVRRARAQWDSVRTELERELAADDLKRSIGEQTRSLREQARELGEALKQDTAGVRAAAEDGRRELEAATRAGEEALQAPPPPATPPASPADDDAAAPRPRQDSGHPSP